MRKLLLILVFLQYLVSSQGQSIVVNPASSSESNLNAEDLLKNVLLSSECSTATNFQLKDNPFNQFPNSNRSWGYFTKGTSNFPFEKGIVLTTGFAKDAEGPDSGIMNKGSDDWVGDADADALALIFTNNVTVFEFDFVPQSNHISFNYIFASEEYPDFACSSFNDVFAFIISGPGITPDPNLSGKNIALLPNGLPVTINTVNDQECGDINYYVPGPFSDIEYGGRTIPLTAESDVIAGETYHIRLLVADALDTNYDSAVFLEGGSFNMGTTIVDENDVALGDDLYLCGVDNYTLYIGAETQGYEIQWFLNGDPIPGANSNSLTINQSGIYRVDISNGTCTASDEINVTFGELQTNGTSFTLEKIDMDGNGTEVFDLTDVESMALNDPSIATFKYYPTETDAQNQTNSIANPTSFVAADQTVVWARVMSVQGGATCYTIIKITLIVKPNCINPEPACSDDDGFGLNIPFLGDGEIPTSAPSGPNYGCLFNQPYPRFFYFKIAESGDLYFNLNQYTQPDQQGSPIDVDFIVWGPFTEVPCNYGDLQQVVSCSYSASAFEYVSIPNAQQGEYYIMMITNYAGSYGQFGYVNLVFDTANSTGSFDCSIVTGDKTYGECDNDQDGQVTFDLEAIATDLTDGNIGLTVKYYSEEEDAIEDTNNNVIPSDEPFVVTADDSPVTIFGQVKDGSGTITKVWTVNLKINNGVEGAHDGEIASCEIGGNGLGQVDLTSVELIDNQEDYDLTYYESEEDAFEGNDNFIANPEAYQTEGTTVYVRIENGEGCFVIVKIVIEITGLEVDLGEDFTMCEGEATLTPTGNYGTNVTYTWELDGEIIPGQNGSTLVITGPGAYSVVVTSPEGCSGGDTVVVGLEDLEVNLGEDFTMCEGSAVLTATGDFEGFQNVVYSWTMNGEPMDIENTQSIEVSEPGIYTVTVESEWGCTGTASVEVSLGEIVIDLGEDFSMCEGEREIFVSGLDGYETATFTWTFNGEIIEGANGSSYTVTQTGTYSVTVQTEWGCTGTDTVVVTPGQGPEITGVTYGPDYIQVNATGGAEPYEYSMTGVVWQSSNQFNYLHPGDYTVFVRSAEGCISSFDFVLFKIPTMFTPNGDGINDTWNIPGLEVYPGSNVVIYDRSGRLVYKAELTSNTIWDGYYMNGQKAPTQDYWYVIEITDGRKFTGHVTVKSRGEKN